METSSRHGRGRSPATKSKTSKPPGFADHRRVNLDRLIIRFEDHRGGTRYFPLNQFIRSDVPNRLRVSSDFDYRKFEWHVIEIMNRENARLKLGFAFPGSREGEEELPVTCKEDFWLILTYIQSGDLNRHIEEESDPGSATPVIRVKYKHPPLYPREPIYKNRKIDRPRSRSPSTSSSRSPSRPLSEEGEEEKEKKKERKEKRRKEKRRRR